VTDITEKLERLASLLERGHLTSDEFARQKAALLATPSGSVAPDGIGAYRIDGPIGEGGMGAVYRGRHRSDAIARRQGGDVAIKVMRAGLARTPDFRARFEREASLGLMLDHPGIVRVHDLVMDGGTLALVMEHVEGRSLAEMIGHEVGPIPWSRARRMLDQLLDAVEYAHSRRVIHRDLKPDNVMVTHEGQLKVLDFGIAKEVGSAGATATGAGLGTVDYMAPEQHTDAKNVDERADIYAIGMTLYEMLAGRLPWSEGLDAVGVLHAKLEGDLPPPTAFYPHIPDPVVPAVMSALAADPGDRTADVAALRADIEAVDRVLEAAAPRPPPPGPPPARPTPPATPARSGPDAGSTPAARGRALPLLAVAALGLALVAVAVVVTVASLLWGESEELPRTGPDTTAEAPTTGRAAAILDVGLDETIPGDLWVGHRGLTGSELTLTVNGEESDATLLSSEPTLRWRPLFFIVDQANIAPERLDKVARNVSRIATRELEAGSRLVVVGDQLGTGAEISSLDGVERVLEPVLASWSPLVSPSSRTPLYSTVSTALARRLGDVPMARAKPWALVFSSLCVHSEDPAPEGLADFDGPIRFLTWDTGLHHDCLENREIWLARLRAAREIEVLNIDDPGQAEAVRAALRQRGGEVEDGITTFSGLRYRRGPLRLTVSAPGVESFQATWTADSLPSEWQRQARVCGLAPASAGPLGLLLLLACLVAGRRPVRRS